MKIVASVLGVLILFAGIGYQLVRNKPTGPEPQKIIKPTYFPDLKNLGRVTARRLFTQMKGAQLVVLASDPRLKNYQEIWYEFVKANLVDGKSFKSIYTVAGLKPITGNDQVIRLLSDVNLQEGPVVVQVPSSDVWRRQVQVYLPNADIEIFQWPFSLFGERRDELGLKCRDKKDDEFNCLSYQASTRYYRKKLTENRLTAMLEQHSENFYLLLVGEAY